MKTALICGVGGQDGSFLARLLLQKGYRVFGTSRDAQGGGFANLHRLGIWQDVRLLSMAPEDFRSVFMALKSSELDEVYFLAGQSSVGLSFEQPAETIQSFTLGTLNVLEACRMLNQSIRQYHAGLSECFGDTAGVPATETTPFRPRSPYAVAKASAYWLVDNYREAYGLYACTGILFNHESPLRPGRFVTQKIVQAAKRIADDDVLATNSLEDLLEFKPVLVVGYFYSKSIFAALIGRFFGARVVLTGGADQVSPVLLSGYRLFARRLAALLCLFLAHRILLSCTDDVINFRKICFGIPALKNKIEFVNHVVVPTPLARILRLPVDGEFHAFTLCWMGNVHNVRRKGVDNLVDLIVTCITHPAAANQTFVVSDGEDVSTTELLRRMGRAMGRPARLLPVPASWLKLAAELVGKPDVAQRLCGSLQVDIEKTRRLLGWTPPLSLDEGLRRAALANDVRLH